MRIFSTIIGVCAAGALFAGGVFTGQRCSNGGLAAGVEKPDANKESDAGKRVASGAENDISRRIRAQETEVKKARQEMLRAVKRQGGRGRSGGNQLALERNVSELAVQLKTLKSLNGDDFFRAAIDMGLGSSTIQKLYPEYQKDVLTYSSILKSGFGPKHPKAAGLKESIDLKAAQLEAAAESLEVMMNGQLESAQKMISEPQKRSGESPADAPDEYATARERYETQLHMLEQLKAQAGESQAPRTERRYLLPGPD